MQDDSRPAATQVDPIAASPGFFKTRLVKGGAFLPARLWREERRGADGALTEDVRFFAELGLDPVDPFAPPGWPWTQIAERDWLYLHADLIWCLAHNKEAPICNPKIPAHKAVREVF